MTVVFISDKSITRFRGNNVSLESLDIISQSQSPRQCRAATTKHFSDRMNGGEYGKGMVPDSVRFSQPVIEATRVFSQKDS